MNYQIKVEPEALADIQQITEWYAEKQVALGQQFQRTAIKQIDGLSKNPHAYAIRYKYIRCLLIQKFPYMVHFYINEKEKTVEVFAVINTSRNPKIWLSKTSK